MKLPIEKSKGPWKKGKKTIEIGHKDYNKANDLFYGQEVKILRGIKEGFIGSVFEEYDPEHDQVGIMLPNGDQRYLGINDVEIQKSKKETVGQAKREGSYEGFGKVEAAAKKSGAKNPAAVAAVIGREKYGKKRFQSLAAKGKKKSY